jgi:hypothetical protein
MNVRINVAAAVILGLAAGAALAQAKAPIKTGVDATFAPYAMPQARALICATSSGGEDPGAARARALLESG